VHRRSSWPDEPRPGREAPDYSGALVAVLVAMVLASLRGWLLSATGLLGRISPAWLALALGAEIMSFLAAAEL
jgi:hypothetical protein